MARDDYGAINVISDEEREALGLGGSGKPDEEEGLFETIGKAGDKLGETKVGQKIGSILTVLIIAMFGSGTADLGMLTELWGEDEVGPVGGCMDPGAINFNSKATFDNGSCAFPPPVIYGCTNPEADNYNKEATHDNGRCQFLGGPGDNNTVHNETTTNETVYGCMDIEAENYNDRAEEDDGSCEYEAYECTANQTYFYNGMQYGNYSRADTSTLNITIDIDTNCDQDTLPVMVYYDVGHLKVEDNETLWNGYMFNNYFFNVTGWEANDYQLSSGPEYFTEPYTGYYIMYVNLWADYGRNGTYDYVDYFIIEEILLDE
jgi:hypothetical protein|tara:strand:- start:309 stop:1262 length:954 start_codon:yes stop_codon:yes gene_type:complete